MGNNQNCCHADVLQSPMDTFEAMRQHSLQLFFRKFPLIQDALINDRNKLAKYFEFKMELFDEGRYYGQMKSNKRHGIGAMLYDQGIFYEGQWKTNQRSGKGRIIYSDGDVYDGNWIEDEPQGEGTYICNNDVSKRYLGNWKNGLQSGHGLEYHQDGTFYDGNFEEGYKHGYGKLIYKNGTYYEGNFQYNHIQGQGKFMGIKHKYQGNWKRNKMHGVGKSEWYDEKGQITATYIGQYQNGQKQGFGQFIWNNGTTYKGKFVNGLIQQQGLFVDRPIQNMKKQEQVIGN